MARLLSSIFGEFRGKLGGSVFSRNKAGMYIRSHIKPTEPNTTFQVNARSRFGSAASSWCSLTAAIKATWRDFASNPSRFNPIKGVNVGQFSGFNSYVSLRNQVNNASDRTITGTYRQLSTKAALTGTVVPFTSSTAPPNTGLSGNIANATGNPAGMSVTGFSLASTGLFTASIAFTGVTSLQANLLVDEFGNKFGFNMYLSDAVKRAGNRVANPYFLNLGSIPPLASTAGTVLTGEVGMYVEGTSDAVAPYVKYGVVAGSAHDASVVAVSETGMMKLIGKFPVTVT